MGLQCTALTLIATKFDWTTCLQHKAFVTSNTDYGHYGKGSFCGRGWRMLTPLCVWQKSDCGVERRMIYSACGTTTAMGISVKSVIYGKNAPHCYNTSVLMAGPEFSGIIFATESRPITANHVAYHLLLCSPVFTWNTVSDLRSTLSMHSDKA